MFSLALKGVKRKKFQTVLIAVVLIISLAFAVMTISYSESILATNSNYRYYIYGSWYGSFTNVESEDIEYLESAEWLDTYGLSFCYGTTGQTGIGVLDDAFVNFGVRMNDGHLPTESGEIAMEADELSSLGYDYSLGQDIDVMVSFSAGNETIYVSQTFTLCGIIAEYSDIWTASTGAELNGAVITEYDAETLYNSAMQIASAQKLELDAPIVTCIFSSKSGSETKAQSEVNSYLHNVSKSTVTINSAYLSNESDTSFKAFYVFMIFAVSLLAVVIVYILQMQAEIRRIVRLRSIGATKGQALRLVILETLIIAIPSIVLGVIVGAFGLWLLLRLSIYTGSVEIIISMPAVVLAFVFAMWIAGIIVVRLLTVQVALLTPLTGRMVMQVKKSRRSDRLRKATVTALSTVICIVLIYAILTAIPYVYAYKLDVANPSYTISTYYAISDEEIDTISGIPGISDAWGFARVFAGITIDDITVSNATFYIIDENDGWDGAFDFSKVDLEAFHNGDCVLLIIPDTDTTSAVPKVGEDMTVTFFGVDITTTIGAINNFKALNGIGYNYGFLFNTYDVVCSRAFLQKMIDALPEDGSVSYYSRSFESGDTATFNSAYAFADSNATYLSTDKAISSYALSHGWGLFNNRERYTTQLQSISQTLILLLISGITIALVTLIILSSTIRLETQREKRRYGILQALGMSKRQRNLELMRTALIRSIVAVILGWGVFILTVILRNLESIKEEGATVLSVINDYMSNITNYYMPVWAMAVMTVALFAVVFLICYVSKLSLNRYSLMEMLHDE